MLVLSRKLEEEIIITHQGVEISVKVLEIQPGQVRLGFSAPKSVLIMRKEVIGRENPRRDQEVQNA